MVTTPRKSINPQHSEVQPFSILGFVTSAWLFYTIVFGGVSVPNTVQLAIQSVSSALMILCALWYMRGGFPSPLARLGGLLLLLCFIIVFAQMVPLPPTWWGKLPGREFQIKMLEVLGTNLPWQPLSLTPNATRLTAIALLPAAAGYLAAVSSRPSSRIIHMMVVVLCAFIGLAIGLVQKFQGPDSSFYFYGLQAGLSGITGTFGNRNFFASQLYVTIPIVAALAVAAQIKFRLPNWLVVIFALLYVSILMVGLAGTGSRAGTALSMLAVFLAVCLVFRPQNLDRSTHSKGWAAFTIVAAMLLTSQVGMVSILRLAEGELIDLRGQIFESSWSIAMHFFPVGSGFGSFIPVYQMFETPSVVISSYINHAHNDWLELLMEGGAPAAFAIVMFVMIYITAFSQVLRLQQNTTDRAIMRAAACVVLLLLIHATVDFGLRTPALLALFGYCCGLATLAKKQHSGEGLKFKKSYPDETSFAPVTRRKPIRGFGPQTHVEEGAI
jgi:O-antigen ligase